MNAKRPRTPRTDRPLLVPALATALIFGLGASASVLNPQQVRVKVEEVAGSVHCLYGQGGNIGLFAGDEAVLLIDDQFERLAKKIEKAVATVTDREVDFLLNTHWHGDHTGGNAFLGDKGVRIFAHENVRRRLAGDPEIGGRTAEGTPPQALPVVTYEDGISFWLNGERVRVRHFPSGHTDGDSVVVFEGSKVVHMGDLFFQGRFPFVDESTGGSVAGLVAAVSEVDELLDGDWRVIPGHGRVCGVDEYRRYLEMLRSTRRVVDEAVASGKDADAIEAGDLLAEWASFGEGFISTRRWIDTLVAQAGRR